MSANNGVVNLITDSKVVFASGERVEDSLRQYCLPCIEVWGHPRPIPGQPVIEPAMSRELGEAVLYDVDLVRNILGWMPAAYLALMYCQGAPNRLILNTARSYLQYIGYKGSCARCAVFPRAYILNSHDIAEKRVNIDKLYNSIQYCMAEYIVLPGAPCDAVITAHAAGCRMKLKFGKGAIISAEMTTKLTGILPGIMKYSKGVVYVTGSVFKQCTINDRSLMCALVERLRSGGIVITDMSIAEFSADCKDIFRGLLFGIPGVPVDVLRYVLETYRSNTRIHYKDVSVPIELMDEFPERFEWELICQDMYVPAELLRKHESHVLWFRYQGCRWHSVEEIKLIKDFIDIEKIRFVSDEVAIEYADQLDWWNVRTDMLSLATFARIGRYILGSYESSKLAIVTTELPICSILGL